MCISRLAATGFHCRGSFFNLTVTMLVMGLWHGASNTFLVWGALHGLMLAIHRMFAFATSHIKSVIPRYIGRIIAMFFTFHCVTFAWIFFRSPDFKTAGLMFQKILEIIILPGQIFAQPQNFASYYLEYYLFIAGIFIIIEIIDEKSYLNLRSANFKEKWEQLFETVTIPITSIRLIPGTTKIKIKLLEAHEPAEGSINFIRLTCQKNLSH